MSHKMIKEAKIVAQKELCAGIFDLTLSVGEMAAEAIPGQFISLFTNEDRHLLPRPISICEIDRKNETLRLVYRVSGEGTKIFSEMKEGEMLRVMGPLGNGFPKLSGTALLIGGGIGVPPMVGLGEKLKDQGMHVISACGYRSDRFLEEEFQANGEFLVATEDGSFGTKGTVIDALKEHPVDCDVICACGPMPMLKAVAAYAEERGVPCYISLEERMACGIGACLGCVCKTKKVDEHSNSNRSRVCTDGPVYLATEVSL